VGNVGAGERTLLKMVEIEFIRKKHYVDGWSIRAISRRLGVSRQAIRRALASAERPRYRLSKPRPCPVIDPVRAIIQGWLGADAAAPPKQRHTAKRIYDRLVAEHRFSGAEVTVRRFVRQLRGAAAEVYVPLTAGWGQQAQVDWGQATVGIGGQAVVAHLFCLRLRASGVPFVWAAPTEKLEAFLEGHRRAFEWLGGVPAECVYDNPKTAVVRILAGPAREEHAVFASLRAHYLFDSLFCRPGEGHEKGAVENLVGYARRNALVPVPDVPTWEALNAHLLAWCERERARLAERWATEQPRLRPLPARPFACALTRLVPVSRLSLVRADHVRYSAPCRYAGRALRLALSTDRVELFDGAERVASHARRYRRGETVLVLEHYLPALARKPRAAAHAAVIEQLPPAYAAARDRLCRGQVDGYRAFVAILLLHREFPTPVVTAALEEAIARDCLTPAAVRQLALNRTAPPPAAPLAVPAVLAEARVSPPDVARYDRLLAAVAP
jgi:transposase